MGLFGECYYHLIDPEISKEYDLDDYRDIHTIKQINDECLLSNFEKDLVLIRFKSSEGVINADISEKVVKYSNPLFINNFFISKNKIVLDSKTEIHFHNFHIQ